MTFLSRVDSPVSRPEVVKPHSETAPSFHDYYRKDKGTSPTPTEDQLAFRRYVESGESKTLDPEEAAVAAAEEVAPEPVAPEHPAFTPPMDDVPEF